MTWIDRMLPKFVRVIAVASVAALPVLAGAQDALFIDSAGNVGLGTNTPQVELHVLATGEAPTDVQFKVEANTDPAFDFAEQDSGVTWRFINNNAVWKVADVGSGADAKEELTLNQAGDLKISGEIFTSGGCSGGCDLLFDPAHRPESIEEHAELMWANKHLPAVGPTAENGAFNLSRMTGAMLNELEKAHIYIEELHDRLARQEQLNAALAERLETLESRMAQQMVDQR